MADNLSGGEPQLAAVLKQLAPFMPGVAGAVLSLAFGEKLTLRGKALSVVVGLASAIFIAPAMVAVTGLFWPGGTLPQAIGSSLNFLSGLFGMIAFAGFAQAVARYAKDPLRLVRFRVGGLEVGGGVSGGPPAAGEGA